MSASSSESTQCISSLLEFGTACTEAEKTNMRRDALRKTNTEYINAARSKFDAEAVILRSLLETVRTTNNQSAPLQAYYDELQAQQKALEEENYNLQQQIRAGRRRFLDMEPQEGVLSILGLRTSDDRIMLVFWLFYGFSILVGIVLGITMYGESFGLLSMNQKVGLGVALFLGAYFIAFFFIYNYA